MTWAKFFLSLHPIVLIPDCDLPRATDTVPLAILAIIVVPIKKKPPIIQVFKNKAF